VSVLLFFIDGLGIGTRGPQNPLDDLPDAEPLALFQNEEQPIPFGGELAVTDACLGVDGRPQSASGQTTILTGVNAPAAVGYHKQGFPNAPLLDIIREHSIFLQLQLGHNQKVYQHYFFSRKHHVQNARKVFHLSF